MTAELFFHRLTELVPHFFGLRDLYFLRLSQNGPRELPHVTKYLNLSSAPVPYKVGGGEHYCARWPALRALEDLAGRAEGRGRRGPVVASGRSRFVTQNVEFLSLAVARPLALHPDGASSVELGFLDGPELRRVVRFASDPAIPRRDVGLTCERCPLTRAECAERQAPASLWRRDRDRDAKRSALAQLAELPAR